MLMAQRLKNQLVDSHACQKSKKKYTKNTKIMLASPLRQEGIKMGFHTWANKKNIKKKQQKSLKTFV